jgi:putative heme-binding domain-containing protein
MHGDWRVCRLSNELTRRFGSDFFLHDLEKDPGVLISGAPNLKDVKHLQLTLFHALDQHGGARDPHLRYEAAWHLAKHADLETLNWFLGSATADVRLAGLIAIDVACYENFPSKKASLEALAKALENPGKLDHQLLLEVARLNGDATIVPSLEKLIARDDVPTATVAKAFLILKAKAGPAYSVKAQGAGKRFIEAVEKGTLPIKTTADQLVLFEFLESEGPTPFALKHVGGQLQSANKELRLAAHTLARRFGPNAATLAEPLWPGVLNPKTKFEDAIESLSTIARVEKASKKEQWQQLLKHDDPMMRAEAVRWWRRFENQPEFIGILNERAVDLNQKDPNIGDDIYMVARHLTKKTIGKDRPKDELASHAAKELADMPDADRTKRAAMGLQVFERNACTKCHTTATATTPLAPSLKGIAQQKVDYLIESVLHPSKVIKTGWEVESIETKDGKVVTGLVKEEGKALRVIQAMDYLGKPLLIDKASIESRSTSKISLMPEGQEATLSRREFVDLIAYLQTLK